MLIIYVGMNLSTVVPKVPKITAELTPELFVILPTLTSNCIRNEADFIKSFFSPMVSEFANLHLTVDSLKWNSANLSVSSTSVKIIAVLTFCWAWFPFRFPLRATQRHLPPVTGCSELWPPDSFCRFLSSQVISCRGPTALCEVYGNLTSRWWRRWVVPVLFSQSFSVCSVSI